jgi:SAM-dependent methyltransferase
MDREFDCPVCSQRKWRALPALSYRSGETEVQGRALSEWELLRRGLLFEVWFPGSSRVSLQPRLCEACGFVTYAPRPSVADVAAKYEYLKRREPDIGGSDSSPRGARLDGERAARTRRAIVSALGGEPARVLDFGGGDGKLLRPFLDRGTDCWLVDFNPTPLPGVRKLGDTLEALPPVAPFDAIICSHVLEHLADPASALRALAQLLQPKGVIFSEVPLEIWKGIPIEREPVTHINFFTLPTLAELHRRCGLEPVQARSLRGSYGAARKRVAVVVARPARTMTRSEPELRSSVAQTRRRLDPDLRDELVHSWQERRLPTPGGVLRRLTRSGG